MYCNKIIEVTDLRQITSKMVQTSNSKTISFYKKLNFIINTNTQNFFNLNINNYQVDKK